MSNTLKFGNGQWATKEGSTLAYNDENNNFKPLPFNFERGSSATVVNKDGLIETVGSDMPRIDYKDDSEGALLLEPQRTNYLTQSNQFDTTWDLQNITISSNQNGVGGSVDAWKLIPNTVNSSHRITNSASGTQNLAVTLSVYAKADGYNFLRISENGSTGDYATFNLLDGIVENNTSSEAKIESVGNGWYRCSSSIVATTSHRFDMYVMESATIQEPLQGNGTSGVYIQYAQLEEGSYATSYIPTQGSAVTRLADSCSQTTPSGVIGQTEGTMYAEIDFKSKPESGSPIVGVMALNNNVTNLQNCIILGIERQSGGVNRFFPLVRVGNSDVAFIIGGTLTDGNYKVAFAYKQNDFILYVNGVQIGTDTNGAVPTTSQVLVGERFNGDTFKIAEGIKETKLYNTRLSNSELAALTS